MANNILYDTLSIENRRVAVKAVFHRTGQTFSYVGVFALKARLILFSSTTITKRYRSRLRAIYNTLRQNFDSESKESPCNSRCGCSESLRR